jgi:hypothetical protein
MDEELRKFSKQGVRTRLEKPFLGGLVPVNDILKNTHSGYSTSQPPSKQVQLNPLKIDKKTGQAPQGNGSVELVDPQILTAG